MVDFGCYENFFIILFIINKENVTNMHAKIVIIIIIINIQIFLDISERDTKILFGNSRNNSNKLNYKYCLCTSYKYLPE